MQHVTKTTVAPTTTMPGVYACILRVIKFYGNRVGKDGGAWCNIVHLKCIGDLEVSASWDFEFRAPDLANLTCEDISYHRMEVWPATTEHHARERHCVAAGARDRIGGPSESAEFTVACTKYNSVYHGTAVLPCRAIVMYLTMCEVLLRCLRCAC